MEAVAASTEISILGWSVVLLLVQIVLQASVLVMTPRYLFSPRDEQKDQQRAGRRLKRALRNLLETYPAFIALVVGLAATGKTGGMAATGAMIWISAVSSTWCSCDGHSGCRTRDLAWSIIGLVMMLIQWMR